MKRLFQTMAAMALLLIVAVPASDANANTTVARAHGAGRAVITYDQCEMSAWAPGGTERPGCLESAGTASTFSIRATIDADGSAEGRLRFNVGNPLDADSWYGSEFYDRAVRFVLEGEVLSGYVRDDGAVVFEGVTDVTDYPHSPRETFATACDRPDCFEPRVPFEVVIGGSLGENGMTLKWCEVPGPLAVEITSGHVHTRVPGGLPIGRAAEAQGASESGGCRSQS